MVNPALHGVQLCFDRVDATRLPGLCFDWLTRGKETFGDGLLGADPLPFFVYDRVRNLDGPQTGDRVRAWWNVEFASRSGDQRWLKVSVNDESWILLGELFGSGTLEFAEVRISKGFGSRLFYQRVGWSPLDGYAVLTATGVPILEDHAAEDRLLAMTRDFAEVASPAFGHIGEFQRSDQTALEVALDIETRKMSDLMRRDRLRGYSWLTVICRELADELGGEPALTASGAFYAVERLPSGAVWLQATRRHEQYDGAAAERVFHALRKVLLPGLPKPAVNNDFARNLVLEDARSPS